MHFFSFFFILTFLLSNLITFLFFIILGDLKCCRSATEVLQIIFEL
jgi:hypothetical protein